jgi:hypothetical protein
MNTEIKSFLGIKNQEEKEFADSLAIMSESEIFTLAGDLSKECHIPFPQAKIGYQLRSPRGLVADNKEYECHSFLRNFYSFMMGSLLYADNSDVAFSDGNNSIKDTGGIIRPANFPACYAFNDGSTNLNTRSAIAIGGGATIGTTTKSIVVGSNDTAATFDDFALNTLIAHGNGVGQLWYAWSFIYNHWDAVSRKLYSRHLRYFDNFNINSCTIKEAGLIWGIYVYEVGPSVRNIFAMMIRDIITPNLIIPYRYQAKIYFDLNVILP